MQLIPPLTTDPAASAREQSAGKHLPYGRHVDGQTIETRDGLLIQILRVRGLLFETADTEELNYRKRLRDALFQAVGSSRFAIFHHVIRRETEVGCPAIFPDSFSQRLDTMWRARLGGRKLYVNEHYLTLVRRPLRVRLSGLARLRRSLGRVADDFQTSRYDLQQLTQAREAIVASLGNYGPQVLGVYETPQGPCSELLEFLSYLFNGELRSVLLPQQDLGEYLPYRRVSFGESTVELGPAGANPRSFLGLVSIKDYAGQTAPGMLDELLRLPFELTVSQSFGFVERRTALSRMNLALRRMRSAEDEAISLRTELLNAKDEAAAGRASFGEHHMTVAVRSDTPAGVDQGVAEVQAALGDLGITAVREDIALEPAFWAQFPGNFQYIARRGLISTANFAGLASCHNFALGNPSGNHWGEAVSLLETTAAGPYYFNFHQGDLGNFTVIGPSGSGKTVVLNFLLAQARKFRPRIVFFDKDRGAELFIRAIGGRYDTLRPGTPSGLNPLQLPDSALNRQFLRQWLSALAGGVDGVELARIGEAVDANFGQPLQHRRLRYIVELFRGGHRPTSRSDLQPRGARGRSTRRRPYRVCHR